MQKVVQNIRRSLSEVPREIYILYYMPVYRSLLDECRCLTLVKQSPWYCIYKASGAYFPG
jgi:hypothetical protein